jgi:hypothetical protein
VASSTAPSSSLRTQSRRMGGAKRYPSLRGRGLMGIASLHPSYYRHSFAISRRVAPEVFHFVSPPQKRRVRGRPGARCTRGLVCKVRKKSAHEHTGSAESIRPSLRSGFTAYSVLSPVNGSFATVISGTPRSIHLDRCATANLTPAPRRQDHTTSPYASRALVLHAHRVHRIPPHVRDDREPPLDWVRRAELCR